METKQSEWNGFKRLDFVFEDRSCILVCPNKATDGNKWMYKTEYFDAFPDVSIKMLERGYYVAYMKNKSRWVHPEDTDARARFCEFMSKEFNLNRQCAIIGMSCGGMQGALFCAKHPQYVAAAYLDAPVMNYLSCPFGLGVGKGENHAEFTKDFGLDLSQMLNYRNHPIDHKDEMVKSGVPILLVCGDSDTIVPFCENGKVLYDYYIEKGASADIKLIIKKGDHHPHGLSDNTPIIEFILEHY